MLDRIPASMITPRVLTDAVCDTNGMILTFSDGSTKTLTCSGGGGGEVTPPPPSPSITINGGTTVNVLTGANLSVRVQNVAAGTAITWAGTGASSGDALVASLNSAAGTSTGTDFTVTTVNVGSSARSVNLTASVSGTVVATFAITISADAVDFQIGALSAISLTTSQSTTQAVTVALSNIVGNIGTVTVTHSGPASIVVSPVNQALTSSATSKVFNIGVGSGLTAGTYTITFTGSNGTISRSQTLTVNVTSSVVYEAPVLSFKFEPGMPVNEGSLDSSFGLKITNVYPGSTVVLTGLNSTPSDLTPFFSAYLNTSTNTFETPISLKSTLNILDFWFAQNGGRDLSISQIVKNLKCTVTGPDSVARTSNTVPVTFKHPVSISTGLTATKDRISMANTGLIQTIPITFYAPKYANKKVLFVNSYNGYATEVNVATLDAAGNGLFNFVFDDGDVEDFYTLGGGYFTIQAHAYSDATGSNVRISRLANLSLDVDPSGGTANVDPPYIFGLVNAALPIDITWLNSSNTPLHLTAISGTHGATQDTNVHMDLNLTVTAASISGGFKLKISNLLVQKSSAADTSTPYILITGSDFSSVPNSSFNEFTQVGNSATGTSVYYGAQKTPYTGSDIVFNFSYDVVQAALNEPTATETGFGVAIATWNSSTNTYQIFRHIGINVRK